MNQLTINGRTQIYYHSSKISETRSLLTITSRTLFTNTKPIFELKVSFVVNWVKTPVPFLHALNKTPIKEIESTRQHYKYLKILIESIFMFNIFLC